MLTTESPAPGGRWSDWLDDLPIDFTAMANSINGDFLALVVDEVNDTVVSLADPVAIVVASELLGAVWPRVFDQGMSSLNNAKPIALATDGLQLFPGGGLYEDSDSRPRRFMPARSSRRKRFSPISDDQ